MPIKTIHFVVALEALDIMRVFISSVPKTKCPAFIHGHYRSHHYHGVHWSCQLTWPGQRLFDLAGSTLECLLLYTKHD